MLLIFMLKTQEYRSQETEYRIQNEFDSRYFILYSDFCLLNAAEERGLI